MNDSLKELSVLLKKSVFVPELSAGTKESVLIEITDTLVANGKIDRASRDSVLAALVEREGKMSTGMQYGVAIPHAKTDLVDELITIVAVSPKGIDFGSLDGEDSTIFVGTLSPPSDANSHIKFLAEVSRQLSNRKIREKVQNAKTTEELIEAVCGVQDPA